MYSRWKSVICEVIGLSKVGISKGGKYTTYLSQLAVCDQFWELLDKWAVK